MQSSSRLTSSTATSFFTGSFELEDEVKTLEDYVVGQRLGEGAYGSVYVVKYIPSGDRFALKILQKQDLFTSSGIYPPFAAHSGEGACDGMEDDSSPLGHATAAPPAAPTAAVSLVKTFEQNIIAEAMVMQALEHPHVVKFYKFLNSTTAFYFVMELAEGGELFDLILSKRYFAEEEARRYFQQLISAIDYCHRNGVAHKDLKAENLLLSNDGRLLVCDFGFSSKVAKENIDDPEETVGTGNNIALLDAIHNASMFGTLHYTSPEAVLASSQQRGFDRFSTDDGEAGSTRFGSAAGRPRSPSTSVSSSSSDSPMSSRSGSTARRGRRCCRDASSPRGMQAMRVTPPVAPPSETAAAAGQRWQEERARPTPPPSSADARKLGHSSSTHSLSSLTNGTGKSRRKGSPTLSRSKVGEGISSFVKALLGTTSGGGSTSGRHHHHHHRQTSPGASSKTNGTPREKALAHKAASPVTAVVNGRLKLSSPQSATLLAADGAPKGQLGGAAKGASPQEPPSAFTSGVSSPTTSPMTASFQTNPSFAESASRAGAAAGANAAARRSTLPPSAGPPALSTASPTTRLTPPIGAYDSGDSCSPAAGTRQRAVHADAAAAAAAVLASQSSTEELSGQSSSLSGETGPRRRDTVLRRPPPVIVDPFQQDLWSAGVILFFMLTGRLPFDGRDEEETLHLIQVNDFAFTEEEVQRISPAVRQLVTQMLAAEPTERPSTEQIIQNPWFQVDLDARKDFPHREDLIEAQASARHGVAAPLTLEEHVMVDGAIGLPRSSSASNVDSSANSSGGGGGTGVAGRSSLFPAAGDGVSVTHVPPSTTTSAAAAVGGGGTPTSGRGERANSSSFSSTFLDFSTQHPVSAEEERVLATAFRKVDSDGFGCITRDQLRDMLTTLHGDAVPTADVDELIKLFTGDASADHITFQQFREAWVSKDLAHTPFTHSSEFQLANIIGTEMDAVERQVVRQLRAAFDSLDETHSGIIQLDQVRRVFEKCHIPVQREDCLSLIKYFHDTELARCNAHTSLSWHQWRVSPAVTPTASHAPQTPAAAASPLTLPTAAAASSGSGNDSPVAANSGAGRRQLPARAAASPPSASSPSSPMSPSLITISFECFVGGIVKSDILLKHPLGRKLAAATNLAAMFQSRNVTECVRHGFLVTGLQNVILGKLSSVPERLLLLYSDEVVSNTENIHSFRYLGSSALVSGATMSSATPLLMSSSLMAMAASSAPAGPLSAGPCGVSPSSQRSTATSPPTSTHRRGRLSGVSRGLSLNPSNSGASLASGPGERRRESAAGAAAKEVDVGALRTNRPVLAKVPSRTAVTRTDSLGSPALSLDRCGQNDRRTSSAQQQTRSAAVPIPRHPSNSSTGTAAPQPASVQPGNEGGFTSSQAHSLALSSSLRHSPPSHVVRGGSGGGGSLRDRLLRGSYNDLDSVHDDTHSFYSDSRHSSSIVNTSEGTCSASDCALSSPVLAAERERQPPPAAQNKRHKSMGDATAPLLAKRAARPTATTNSGGSSHEAKAPTPRDSVAAKAERPKPHRRDGRGRKTPSSPSDAAGVGQASVDPLANETAAVVGRTRSSAALDERQTSTTAVFSSSLCSPPSSAGYVNAAPSGTFAHRAMAYGGTGAVPLVNGVCDVDVILSPACLGYTMVQFRRIHGKTSDFHEAVTFISNLLELEREQAMEDTLTRGESELM